MLVMREGWQMPVMRGVVPAGQQDSLGILPMKGIALLFVTEKLPGKKKAAITNFYPDFELEALFPSAEIKNVETRNCRRLLK